MDLEVRTNIRAPRAAVWKTITDFENAPQVIRGIEKVEVLEKPAQGILGLKWRETRTVFGKTATETMWITEANEPEFYRTRAESHGAIYLSTIALADKDGGTELSMRFSGQPVTLTAKFFAVALGWMFAKASRKALQQDVQDIKAAVEARSPGTGG